MARLAVLYHSVLLEKPDMGLFGVHLVAQRFAAMWSFVVGMNAGAVIAMVTYHRLWGHVMLDRCMPMFNEAWTATQLGVAGRILNTKSGSTYRELAHVGGRD